MSAILIVHPEIKTLETVRSILEQGGHRVTSAQDGPTALEEFKRGRPDIVILNQQLPKMATYRVFAEIKRVDPHAKVLVFSVQGTGEGREARALFGIRAVLPREVLQIVDRLLGDAEQARTQPERFASRLLIVDDDRGVLDTLGRFLTARAYEVSVAASGMEALPLLKKVRPHLVLLDIDMPMMNGVETLKRIRDQDSQVGVMMITGNDTVEMMERCRDYGAYDYLLKPFDFEYLEFSVYSKILLMTL